jgi:hypothetical protein
MGYRIIVEILIQSQGGEARVANTEKLSSLVETVRILNWEVRPKIAGAPEMNKSGNPLHTALTGIRNNEIEASQQIRSMSLAETIAQQGMERLDEQAEASTIGSRQLLSEFGTAREAILSILRNLSDDQWAAGQETATGERTYLGIVDGLIESDKKFVSQIQSAVT